MFRLSAPPSSSRSGAGGPLVIVLGVVLLLFSLALSSQIRSQGFTVLVQRSVFDDECEMLAQLAVAEGLRYLRVHANQPGHPVFAFMREVAPPVESEIGLGELRALSEDLALHPRYALDGGVQVRMLRRSLLAQVPEERKGYEAIGVVRLTARVTGPEGAEAVEVEEYGFRNVLTGPPRPFDAMTFLLADCSTLLTRRAYTEDPNSTIELAVQQIQGYRDLFLKYAETYEKAADEIGKAISKAGPFGGSKKKKAKKLKSALEAQAAKFRAEREKPTWPAEDWVLAPPPTGAGDPTKIHLFPWPLAVMSMAPSLDLSRLNLPALVGPLVEEFKAMVPELEAVRKRLETNLDGGTPSPEAVQGDSEAFRAGVLPFVAIQHRILTHYKTFQDLLAELAGGNRQMILDRARRLDWSEFRWKADHFFEGPGAASRASTFLNERPNPRGLIVVDDPSETLVLDLREVEGRLVVACKGNLEIRAATVRDLSQDVLTIMGYKGFEVSGPVQAALVSLENSYAPIGDDLTGSLILNKVVPTSPLDQIFAGTLTRQDKVQTGPDPGNPRPPPDPESIHVALGPTPLYRRLVR